jgi:hypothetical protein
MKLIALFTVTTILVTLNPASADGEVDGHFSTWEEVPKIIDSITDTEYRQPLEKLHKLTRIKVGYPQSSLCLNEEEHRLYILDAKEKWSQWWKSTGEPISTQKLHNAKIDQPAFDIAWKFLGTEQEPPVPILPVWIPETWSLYITFSNGDYQGRETELWIIDRKSDSASMTKLRGQYAEGGWNVNLSKVGTFTPQLADRLLKAMCYLHQYAPVENTAVPENEMKRLYYPHSTLRLRDGANRILWNTEDYNFSKAQPEYGDGDSGRSYYFLRSIYPQGEKWEALAHPTSEQLAPYRMSLSLQKPYFCSSASDIIQLFGEQGGSAEKQSMLEWAEKQKAATNPNMDWKVCSDDFNTEAKVNVINFTEIELQQTQQQIKKIGDRIQAQHGVSQGVFDTDRAKEKELDQYITKMQADRKKAEEEAILRYPQPLRDLIIANEHPDDSDLKHLSAAVQKIRAAPDPLLFSQLIQEMHEGTLRMRQLLKHILLNEQSLLGIKPWGNQEKLIAVEACINSLPLAKEDARHDLIEIILHVCGGGKIEVEGENGGTSIEVAITKNGYTLKQGESTHPLTLKDAQIELHRLYKASLAKNLQDTDQPAPKSK